MKYCLVNYFQAQEGGGLQTITGTGSVEGSFISPTTQTVQAITLADGNTAFIQHSGKLMILSGTMLAIKCVGVP